MADRKSKDLETVLAVYHTKDAESASAALLKADITCVRRKIGAGKHGNFLLALNHYGEEICVDPADVERAGHVLEEWRAQKNLRREQEQAADSESTSGAGAGRKALSARILAGIALAVVVFFYLIQGY